LRASQGLRSPVPGKGTCCDQGQQPGLELRSLLAQPLAGGFGGLAGAGRPRAASASQPAKPPSQGLGQKRAELKTRLLPLIAASSFAWHRAAQALGCSQGPLHALCFAQGSGNPGAFCVTGRSRAVAERAFSDTWNVCRRLSDTPLDAAGPRGEPGRDAARGAGLRETQSASEAQREAFPGPSASLCFSALSAPPAARLRTAIPDSFGRL